MDGFLFGACCNLPGVTPGELIESEQASATVPNNDVTSEVKTTKEPYVNVMTNGFSELTFPTSNDNTVQIGGKPLDFLSSGIQHIQNTETYLVNSENNEIQPLDFVSYPVKNTQTTERATTRDDSTPTYSVTSPLIQIQLSHGPGFSSTPSYFQKPMFRPKPQSTLKPQDVNKYVLVPTITHQKPNKTQELESIVNIIQMLNDSSTPSPLLSSYGPSTIYLTTTKQPPSTSYVFSTNIPKRPTTKPLTTTKSTSRKPPSTSYVFSTTNPPKRSTSKRPTILVTGTNNNKPIKTTSTVSIKPGTVTRPVTFVTKKPKPPTTLVFTPTTKRPSSIHTASVVGPSFSVTTPTKSPYTSPRPGSAPNVILIAPITAEPTRIEDTVTSIPPVKPVTQLTINNIVTQTNNYHYSTSPRPQSATIHITPKPPLFTNTAGYLVPISSTDYIPEIDIPDNIANNDLINFPPVRNPNLNISASIAAVDEDGDVTTPAFIEDEALNKKVESFVSKIVLSLQEPFNELKDIVYSKNKTVVKRPSTTSRPTKVTTSKTTKPPRIGTSKPSSSRPVATKATTKRPVTTSKRPVTTRKPTTTTKKTKPTKKVTTTPVYVEEEEDVGEESEEELDYRRRKWY